MKFDFEGHTYRIRFQYAPILVAKGGKVILDNPLEREIRAKAYKGDPSFPSELPLQKNPSVVAQFRTSLGTCWGATFSTPTVNTATEFKATSD